MANIKNPALRYHGAKFRLAPWVISNFPAHRYYTEAFGGAAGVLLNKPRCHGEVYNDLDSDIVNFFSVLRNLEQRNELIELLTLTPYSREEFELSYIHTDEPVERARRTAIRATMGFGSGGSTMAKTGFRTDIKREYGTAMDLWAKYPSNIAAIGQRFTGVQIENKPAIDVITKHDTPDTLHYVDPPYIHSTRYMVGRSRTYKHEMSEDEHAELLNVLKKCSGHVVLSGYDSDLYNDILTGWTKTSKNARISAGRGTGVKTEVLWLSPFSESQQLDLGVA